MKAKDKLRVSWDRKENCLTYYCPLGFQTKCDASYMSGIITDEVAQELYNRGYDITTLKFSIEPIKGNTSFASQRNINETI